MDMYYWYAIGIIIILIILYWYYSKENFTMKYGVPVGLLQAGSHHAAEKAAIAKLNASAEKL